MTMYGGTGICQLRSVHTFEELEKVFKVDFNHRLREKGANNILLNIFQGEKKMCEYMARIIVVVQGINRANDSAVMMALSSGLKGS